MPNEPFVRKPPKQSAANYAVWLLGRREYSAKQLRDKLIFRGYTFEQVEQALAFLQKHRLQDDQRFVENTVRSKASRMGNRKLVQSLKNAGIDEALTVAAVNEGLSESDRVIGAVRKFEGKPLDAALRQKIWRHLAYRGFAGNSIAQAIKHLECVASDSLQSGE